MTRNRVDLELNAPGMMVFRVRSYSGQGKDYLVCVDTQTGEVRCDCPHFQYRLERHAPRLSDGKKLCKHCQAVLRSARARLSRKPPGEVNAA